MPCCSMRVLHPLRRDHRGHARTGAPPPLTLAPPDSQSASDAPASLMGYAAIVEAAHRHSGRRPARRAPVTLCDARLSDECADDHMKPGSLYPLPMALPDGERERLLSLYRDRVDTYIGADPDYAQRWRSWCQTLLSFGGALVVPPRSPE